MLRLERQIQMLAKPNERQLVSKVRFEVIVYKQ
jgi:hypothetical protein